MSVSTILNFIKSKKDQVSLVKSQHPNEMCYRSIKTHSKKTKTSYIDMLSYIKDMLLKLISFVSSLFNITTRKF